MMYTCPTRARPLPCCRSRHVRTCPLPLVKPSYALEIPPHVRFAQRSRQGECRVTGLQSSLEVTARNTTRFQVTAPISSSHLGCLRAMSFLNMVRFATSETPPRSTNLARLVRLLIGRIGLKAPAGPSSGPNLRPDRQLSYKPVRK